MRSIVHPRAARPDRHHTGVEQILDRVIAAMAHRGLAREGSTALLAPPRSCPPRDRARGERLRAVRWRYDKLSAEAVDRLGEIELRNGATRLFGGASYDSEGDVATAPGRRNHAVQPFASEHRS